MQGTHWRPVLYPRNALIRLTWHRMPCSPSAGTNPYADMSSAMGTCCLPRCFNAVQNWQLGGLDAMPVIAVVEPYSKHHSC